MLAQVLFIVADRPIQWLSPAEPHAMPPRGINAPRPRRLTVFEIRERRTPAREKARAKLSCKGQRELEALPGEIEAGGVGVFRRSSAARLMR